MGGEEVPGTIVSVLQAAAGAVEECANGEEGLVQATIAAGDAAVVALDKTPEQLDVLADAGVVDAGGRGLLVLLDALSSTVTGHAPARPVYELSPRAETAVPEAGPPNARTAVRGDVPAGRVRRRSGGHAARAARRAGRIGGDRRGAGRRRGYSVHVHTDDAGAAVEAGLAVGRLSRIQISALTSGAAGLPAGGWTRERAVLAVVDGDGAAELFAGEGACVLQPDADAAIRPRSAPTSWCAPWSTPAPRR